MKNILKVLLISMLVLNFVVTAEAKWWIFGQSNEEVSINYLYLNKVSYDESGPKVTLYRETMDDGKVSITGKASVRKGTVGRVRITVNNKETWEKAKLSSNGSFEFSFIPELNKGYLIYIEVMDTAGKINDIEATRKEITVSEMNILDAVKKVLDSLIDAYKNENASSFMVNVSGDFAGDASTLDRAVRRDFLAFDNIDLRYTINNIASTSKGVLVSLNYNRSLISARNGRSLSDRGSTEFTFKAGDDGIKLFSMKVPLIFGISDPLNVASGMVNAGSNAPTILVDQDGNAVVVSFQTAIKIFNSGDAIKIRENPDGTVTIEAGDIAVVLNRDGTEKPAAPSAADSVESDSNITIISRGHPPGGFSFEDGEAQEGPGSNVDFMITGTCSSGAYGFMHMGAVAADMGPVSLNTVREAPASSYALSDSVCFKQGNTYAFRTKTGKYGLMEVKSVSNDFPTITMKISYKYQKNGSRQF